MIKKVVAILVFVLVVCSVAGCTTTNNTNQTPSTTSSAATQHDAFLEKYLMAYKDASYSKSDPRIEAWVLTWINSTSARLEKKALMTLNITETALAELNMTANVTLNAVQTFTVFPTTQDATNYINAMNLTAYSLASTESPSGTVYQNVTGHAPQIYKEYDYTEGSALNASEYRFHEIIQRDNLVVVGTATR
jgi:hypothetical protein